MLALLVDAERGLFQGDWTGCGNSGWCVAWFFGSAFLAALAIIGVMSVINEWVSPPYGKPKRTLRAVMIKRLRSLNDLLHRL